MSITRDGITDGTKGRPIISGMVVHGDTVYISGVTADLVGDITAQTQQVLERIDAALQRTGTDKSKLLTAQVWLADMRLFEAHNAVWNAWVDPQHPPVRACVGADLAGIVGQRPPLRTCLVEIMVSAAR
jgi:enamine deaminase RidA (YjgF/YER057c/UK114 family)